MPLGAVAAEVVAAGSWSRCWIQILQNRLRSGWWYTYPSEKSESQLGLWNIMKLPTEWKIKLMFQTTNQPSIWGWETPEHPWTKSDQQLSLQVAEQLPAVASPWVQPSCWHVKLSCPGSCHAGRFQDERTSRNHCMTGSVQIMNRKQLIFPAKQIWHGMFLAFCCHTSPLVPELALFWPTLALGAILSLQIHGRVTQSRCHQSQKRSLQQHHRWLKDPPDLVERTLPGPAEFAEMIEKKTVLGMNWIMNLNIGKWRFTLW